MLLQNRPVLDHLLTQTYLLHFRASTTSQGLNLASQGLHHLAIPVQSLPLSPLTWPGHLSLVVCICLQNLQCHPPTMSPRPRSSFVHPERVLFLPMVTSSLPTLKGPLSPTQPLREPSLTPPTPQAFRFHTTYFCTHLFNCNLKEQNKNCLRKGTSYFI